VRREKIVAANSRCGGSAIVEFVCVFPMLMFVLSLTLWLAIIGCDALYNAYATYMDARAAAVTTAQPQGDNPIP
jgi:hypothetical protein